jgi:hypothetical protein
MDMLRIDTEQRGTSFRMELHGTISGEWVAVLERQWRAIRKTAPSASVTLGVSDVAFIDREGERLLRSMARRGVAFDGDGVMNRYVIGKILGELR